MKRQKILDRIKKLLAMGSDTSSPKEAVIAARRARAMMDKYGVKESELKDKSQMGEYVCGRHTFKREPIWIQWISVDVARWNDCVVKRKYIGEDAFGTVFKGFIADTIVASHTFEYLVDRVYILCAGHGFRTRGESYQYKVAATHEICRRIRIEIKERKKDLKTTTGQALVPIKMALVEQHFGFAKYKTGGDTREPNSAECDAYIKGMRDGKTIGLDRQLEGNDQKRLRS